MLEVERLFLAVKELNGVGLAANQFGDPRAYCVIAIPESEPFVMVNPAITGGSREMVAEDEGCLSLPGITVTVERRLKVVAKWLTVDGVEHEEEFGGLAARIVQHEVDHLSGRMILDYLSPLKRAKLKSYINRALRMEKANLKAIAANVGRLAPHAVDMQTAMARRQVEKLVAGK
jgi:peptide deformylase